MPRHSRSYARRAPTREPYDRVLIVCEGEKTEPLYLSGLCQRYELSSANIKITPDAGSDPLKIVNYALQFADEYDKIFCVFDRDNHANFQKALNQVNNSKHGQSGKLRSIVSKPCFEVWVLLHYTYTTTGFVGSPGGRSPCDNVIRAIREHFPQYAKEGLSIFEDLAPRLEQALAHAKRLYKENSETGSVNPATEFHELVEYLRDLKKTVS